jgi:hypothetical protein
MKSTHVSNLKWLSRTIKSTLFCLYILRRPQTVKSVFSLYSTIGRFICLYVFANTVEVLYSHQNTGTDITNFRCSIPNSLLNTHIFMIWVTEISSLRLHMYFTCVCYYEYIYESNVFDYPVVNCSMKFHAASFLRNFPTINRNNLLISWNDLLK